MPIRNGVYTPPTMIQVRQMQTYAGRLLRAGKTPALVIHQKITKKYKMDVGDSPSVSAAINTARAANDAAATARRTHNRILLPSDIPTIAGERSRTGQYKYDLLVQAIDARTGVASSYLHTIYTRSPMSLDMVRANIDANRGFFVKSFESPKLTASQASRVSLSTIILQVGLVG